MTFLPFSSAKLHFHLCVAPSIYIYLFSHHKHWGSFSSLKLTNTHTNTLTQEIPRNFKKRKFSLRQWFFLLLFFLFYPSSHWNTRFLAELFLSWLPLFPHTWTLGENFLRSIPIKSNFSHRSSLLTNTLCFLSALFCCFAFRKKHFSSIFLFYFRVIDSKLLRSFRNLVDKISGNAFSGHTTTNLIMNFCPPFSRLGWPVV